uniref:Tectonin beta-propeller repeat-containing protein 2 n=1 Tax=Clastoptera arizonana TaxID=38151 RepID=A0A1B6D2Y9_9HEMI
MSEPWSEDDGILREWAPLSRLLLEIPHTARRGIFLENVSLTCVDIIPEYIAVGTNIGVVYWYHRETHNLERLRPEKSGSSISCVKIVSTVDFMVAVGDKGGTVTIFRIPKPTSSFLPYNYKQTSNHQVERYTVGGLHTAPVTALEWSVNGQNLFSGDLLGLVVYTEIDFYMNLSKASEILNEKYCIVQLSFSHHCHILLVATEYRCILVHKNESWRVVQIGQKERRSLCHIGATFVHRPKQPLEPLVYSGRSGLRFWHADKQGVVHKTIIFKDAVRKTHPSIRLLNPLPVNTFVYEGDLGPLLVWKSCLLVTHNSSSLLILDLENTSVVASITGLNNLHSVAVSQDEIFIIAGSRSIMRLAYTPDNFRAEDKDLPMAFLELKVAPVADTLMDLSLKLKETASKFVNTQPSNAVNGMVGDQEIVSTAAEALELDLPPILSLESNAIEELTIQQDPKIQILDQIGKQSFEDIIYSTGKKVIKTNKRNLRTKNVSSLSISSELHSDSTNKNKVCNSSPSFSDNEHLLRASGDIPHMSLPQMKPDINISDKEPTSLVIPPGIYPDLRSPDTILKDLQDKEFRVAREYHLEDIWLNINEEKLIPDNYNDEGTFVAPELDIKSNPVSNDYKLLPEKVGVKDTSIVPTTDVISCHSYPEHPLIQEYFQQDDILEENVGWNKVACPEIALTLAVSNDYICITGPGMSVHYGILGENSLVWQKLSYKANELKMSPSADLVWKLDFGVASALTDEIMGLIGCKWELAARCVESVSLGQSVAWYVSGGKVYLQKGLNKTKPFTDSIPISCPIQVTKISCMEMMVLVLTLEHSIMWRCGITDKCEEGTHWRSINIPSSIQGEDITLGPKNTAWILDKSNRLYFSHNYTHDYSEWWQVLILSQSGLQTKRHSLYL